jgi:hypothetical protein
MAEHRLAAVVDQLADDEVQLQVGDGSSGALLMKPPASAKLVVSKPVRCRAIRKCPAARARAVKEMPKRSLSLRRVGDLHHVRVVVQVHGPRRAACARRCRSPADWRCPMPDSIRICGDCSAPAHSSTSRRRGAA